jgi:arsenate reductase-like glutaredoxin family protein
MKVVLMNIQIFGKKKCFSTRSAERFFKERKIKYQYIDIADKGMSSRECDSILANIEDINLLFDKKSKLYEKFNIPYILRTIEDKKQILLENPSLFITPIVRDCDTKKSTIGEQLDIWKKWI